MVKKLMKLSRDSSPNRSQRSTGQRKSHSQLHIAGGGTGADISISDIGSGSVSEIVIDNPGSGYSVGDKLVFDNTGTEGVNAEGFVSVVNGGIAGEDGTKAEHIILEHETGRGDQ